MKINLKEKLEKEDISILDGYINDLPSKFYSANYLEILKYKSKIYKNNYELLKNIEQIDELFSNLGNYYEQLSAFKLLFSEIEIHNEENNDKKNYISISKKDIKQKKKKKSKKKVEEQKKEEMEKQNSNKPPIIVQEEFLEEKKELENIILMYKLLKNLYLCLDIDKKHSSIEKLSELNLDIKEKEILKFFNNFDISEEE